MLGGHVQLQTPQDLFHVDDNAFLDGAAEVGDDVGKGGKDVGAGTTSIVNLARVVSIRPARLRNGGANESTVQLVLSDYVWAQ